jgi:UDPglucose 6-dehydrogenase
MKICITGTCLADFGLSVTCVDQDETKISLLNSGGVPIYEPNLAPLIEKNINNYKVIVIKSTVPVGITRKINEIIHSFSPSPLRGEGRVRVKYPSVIAREQSDRSNPNLNRSTGVSPVYSIPFDLVSFYLT